MSSASSTHGHVSHDSQRLSCKWSWRYSLPVYIAEYGNLFSLSTLLGQWPCSLWQKNCQYLLRELGHVRDNPGSIPYWNGRTVYSTEFRKWFRLFHTYMINPDISCNNWISRKCRIFIRFKKEAWFMNTSLLRWQIILHNIAFYWTLKNYPNVTQVSLG